MVALARSCSFQPLWARTTMMVRCRQESYQFVNSYLISGTLEEHIVCPNQYVKILPRLLRTSATTSKCPRYLQGGHYNVSVAVSKAPFIEFLPKGRLSGSDVDVLNIIKAKLGFTVEFTLEKIWGKRLPGGGWIGSAGSVS
jgi:hypothetical protein